MHCATRPSGCSIGWTTPRGSFTQALDIGGRGVVAPMLRERGIDVVSCDLSPAMAALNDGPTIAADEEWLPFAPGSFDVVVANLSLHWVNDLPGALIQLRHALRHRGLAAGQPACPRHPGRTTSACSPRPRPHSPAVPPRASRPSPICATARDCCNAPASPCRWRTWRSCNCSMPTPSRCCVICVPPVRPTHCVSATTAHAAARTVPRGAGGNAATGRACRGDASSGGDDGVGVSPLRCTAHPDGCVEASGGDHRLPVSQLRSMCMSPISVAIGVQAAAAKKRAPAGSSPVST